MSDEMADEMSLMAMSETSSDTEEYMGKCEKCDRDDHPELLLICDNFCGRSCHTYCCSPRLAAVPEGDWLCPVCYADIAEESSDFTQMCIAKLVDSVQETVDDVHQRQGLPRKLLTAESGQALLTMGEDVKTVRDPYDICRLVGLNRVTLDPLDCMTGKLRESKQWLYVYMLQLATLGLSAQDALSRRPHQEMAMQQLMKDVYNRGPKAAKMHLYNVLPDEWIKRWNVYVSGKEANKVYAIKPDDSSDDDDDDGSESLTKDIDMSDGELNAADIDVVAGLKWADSAGKEDRIEADTPHGAEVAKILLSVDDLCPVGHLINIDNSVNSAVADFRENSRDGKVLKTKGKKTIEMREYHILRDTLLESLQHPELMKHTWAQEMVSTLKAIK